MKDQEQFVNIKQINLKLTLLLETCIQFRRIEFACRYLLFLNVALETYQREFASVQTVRFPVASSLLKRRQNRDYFFF